MDYDWGYFDLGTRVLEPLEKSVRPKLLLVQPVQSVLGENRGGSVPSI